MYEEDRSDRPSNTLPSRVSPMPRSRGSIARRIPIAFLLVSSWRLQPASEREPCQIPPAHCPTFYLLRSFSPKCHAQLATGLVAHTDHRPDATYHKLARKPP